MTNIENKPHQAVILFDGVCNLCNSSVQFIIKNDPKAFFKFASLQSEVGQQVLAKFPEVQPPTTESIIYVENGKIYKFSTAALQIAKHFQTKWKWLYYLIIFPKFLRDWVYRIIAKNRYRWWGKQESCWLPTPELRERFLK